jgi:hypothetical protein
MSPSHPPLKIVRLDGVHAEPPVFTIPHSYIEYPTTSDPSTIPGRIGDADIVLTTRVPITASTLDACPNLKFVAVFAIGYDMIDLVACKERGVKVANVPAASSEFALFCGVGKVSEDAEIWQMRRLLNMRFRSILR